MYIKKNFSIFKIMLQISKFHNFQNFLVIPRNFKLPVDLVVSPRNFTISGQIIHLSTENCKLTVLLIFCIKKITFENSRYCLKIPVFDEEYNGKIGKIAPNGKCPLQLKCGKLNARYIHIMKICWVTMSKVGDARIKSPKNHQLICKYSKAMI